MKKLFILALFMVSCATIAMKVTYETKTGDKFMCKTIVKTATDGQTEGTAQCQFAIEKSGTIYKCAVDADKLKKGYKPDVSVDCELVIK